MDSIHPDRHPLAGKVAILNDTTADPARGIVVAGAEFVVEDWWDRLTGGSWMFANGNPAALQYACRAAGQLPIDNEVVYGHIGPYGHLVHVSELRVAEGEVAA